MATLIKKGNSEAIKNEIIEFCDLISKAGFNLVYGGSDFGMMGFASKNSKEKITIESSPKKLVDLILN